MADGSQYCDSAESRKPNDHVAEVWRPVPSEPGVLASNLGRVLRPPRYAPLPNGGYRAYMPQPRYGAPTKSSKNAQHSYMGITLYSGDPSSRNKPRKVHQLVCEAFHGPKPFASAVVIHLNENAHDNRPENLKWGTMKENLNAEGFLRYCRSRTGENSPVIKGRKKRSANT